MLDLVKDNNVQEMVSFYLDVILYNDVHVRYRDTHGCLWLLSVSRNTSDIILTFCYFFHSHGSTVCGAWYGQELVTHTTASVKVCGEDAELPTLQ